MENPWSNCPRVSSSAGRCKGAVFDRLPMVVQVLVRDRRQWLVAKQVHQVDGLAFVAGDQAAFDQVLQFAHVPAKS